MVIPPRIAKACYAYSYYFSKSEGSNKASIHDMSQKAFPGIFDLSSPSRSNWHTARAAEILKFVQDLFISPASAWLDALSAHRCLVSLAKTRPDKFETFYTHGNLNASTEGALSG